MYLESTLKPEKKELFVEKVTNLSSFIRNVIFRVQLFVNSYVVQNQDSLDLTFITHQNFWYSMSQLIMGEKVTNKKYVSAGIALAFADFKKDHPSIVFSLKDSNIKGYSDSLSAACVVLATTYLNHIVENFKRRVLYYLSLKLSMIYPVSSNYNKIHIYRNLCVINIKILFCLGYG